MQKWISAPIAAFAALVAPQAAQAQDVNSEDAPQVRAVSDMRHQYIEFPFIDGTVVGGRVEGSYTVEESTFAPLDEGDTGDIVCLVQAVIVSGGLGIISPCTMTTPDGDTWSMIAARVSGDIRTGGGGPGEINIVGGTGAFAGISGSGQYDARYSETEPSEVRIAMDLEFEN